MGRLLFAVYKKFRSFKNNFSSIYLYFPEVHYPEPNRSTMGKNSLMVPILLQACIFCSSGFSQEKMGIVNDNYLPMHQHRLNPSAIVDQKPWISINVIGAEAYANGNFVYFPSKRLSPANSFETVDYDNSHEEMKGFVVGEFAGPSISMVLGKSSVALHTRARSYTAIDRIPAVVGQIITDESTDNI